MKKQIQSTNRGDITYVIFHLGAEIAMAFANALEGAATFGAINSRNIDQKKNKQAAQKEFEDSILLSLESMDVTDE